MAENQKGSPLSTAGFKEFFVRINHKSELRFSIIFFQNEANRIYVSEINIVVFKRQSYYFRLNKWDICSTNCYKTYYTVLFEHA